MSGHTQAKVRANCAERHGNATDLARRNPARAGVRLSLANAELSGAPAEEAFNRGVA